MFKWITKYFKKGKKDIFNPPFESLVKNRVYSTGDPNAEKMMNKHLNDVFTKHHG
jgi:hypothetical protein